MEPQKGRTDNQRVVPKSRLFWFLREGVSLDLTDPSLLALYIQQVITGGRMEDVKGLLRTVPFQQLKESLEGLKRFLPGEVRMFWEDFIVGHQ